MRLPVILFAMFIIVASCEKPTMNITIIPEQETPIDTNDGSPSEFDDGEMRNLSSFDIVSEMKIGWNLGNSLDAEGPTETHWGNPVTTRAMIDEVANRGLLP